MLSSTAALGPTYRVHDLAMMARLSNRDRATIRHCALLDYTSNWHPTSSSRRAEAEADRFVAQLVVGRFAIIDARGGLVELVGAALHERRRVDPTPHHLEHVARHVEHAERARRARIAADRIRSVARRIVVPGQIDVRISRDERCAVREPATIR